ncbi:Os03g0363500, partial [Oryza sativa Japonica Group]
FKLFPFVLVTCLPLHLLQTMGLAAIIGIVGWFTIYFANGATMLYLGRVLLGYCTGVLSYVVSISNFSMHI